ncbi:MAG: hypothetical protein U1F52_10805 [Burkholderiales bacterium]
MKLTKSLVAVALVAVLTACSSEKEPAQLAINAAQQAVESARAEGAKFAADKFGELEAALKAAQDQFAKGDYKEALAAAGPLAAKAQEVLKVAAAKKEEAAKAAEAAKAELAKHWEEISASVPTMVDAVTRQLDVLGKAKKLPEGLDKEKLAAMKPALDEAVKALEEAKTAATSGDLAKALETGKGVKDKLVEMAAALGIKQDGQ